MELVIDTNILFSFFRETPVREIIVNSKLFGLALYIPEYALDELRKNELDIIKYSKLKSREEFEFVFSSIELFVKVVTADFFKNFDPRAKKISPHIKDSPFFALALKLNCPIWSNDKRLKKQSEVKILSTEELTELLF